MNPTAQPSPSEREAVLFALAIEKPAAQRAAWLDAECAGDAALRQRLEALLAAHEQTCPALDTVNPCESSLKGGERLWFRPSVPATTGRR